MIKRIISVTAAGLFCLLLYPRVDFAGQAQMKSDLSAFRNNSCVECHSGLTEPVHQVNRYLEWHFSVHKDKGIGCDKCHGGDPSAKARDAAHKGVLKPSDRASRLFTWNQPDTCRGCHQNVADAFTKSNHFIKLKSAGLGPSCNTCHVHMASKVLHSPEEVASNCSNCHNTVNGLLVPRPDIPETARDNVMAFQRSNFIIEWTQLLLTEAERRGLDVTAEKKSLEEASTLSRDAKVQWHTFYLGNVRQLADASFNKAVKARDSLRRKLSR